MKTSTALLASLLIFAGTADAKWWIFGKSDRGVAVKYLRFNGLSADEAETGLTLYRESLPSDGAVTIRGKAAAGRGAVGSVRISLDDQATWREAKLAADGTFEDSFQPEPGRTYVFYLEVTDTAGKTNDVAASRRALTLSTESVQTAVRAALDRLFDAYRREDLAAFMKGVSDNFAADIAILERAVRRDFDALDNIQLRYTLNNVAAGAGGRVFVAVTYNRMVVVAKSGQTHTDRGSTEFVFDRRPDGLYLYSMKQPLMFGLSDAENVATGTVLGGDPQPLTLDETGDAGVGRTLTASNPDRTANTWTYTFADQSSQLEANFATVWVGDVGVDIVHLWMKAGVEGKVFTGKTLSELTAADFISTAGWTTFSPLVGAVNPGDVYGFKVNNRYHAVEILSNDLGDPSFNIVLRVRSF